MKGSLSYTEYMELAFNVQRFMHTTRAVPNKLDTSIGTIPSCNVVYILSQLLNHHKTGHTLPDYVMVYPWSTITNKKIPFFSKGQIIDTARQIKKQTDNHHQLPPNVSVDGVDMPVSSYLGLLTGTILNLDFEGRFILTETAKPSIEIMEDIVDGYMVKEEYLNILKSVKTTIDSTGAAPACINQTSLGSHIGYNTLIYTFSSILNYYHENKKLPDEILVVPSLTLFNPDAVYNYNSNKKFNNIQNAINHNETKNGDKITVGLNSVLENVIVNKNVKLSPLINLNTIIKASNTSLPVFIVTHEGQGSSIQGFQIQGNTNNKDSFLTQGILLNNTAYTWISNNNITGFQEAIHLTNSTHNYIHENKVSNNVNGLYILNQSDYNHIEDNIIEKNSESGVSVKDSNDNHIYRNKITSNQLYGLNFNNSTGNINFNHITFNKMYGFHNPTYNNVDLENNWWGSNNPQIVDKDSPENGFICQTLGFCSIKSADIYLKYGTVGSWIVLNLTSSYNNTQNQNKVYDNLITASLTHNNHDEKIFKDNVPYPTLFQSNPIKFSADNGEIEKTVLMFNGKAETTLKNMNKEGNITAILDQQKVILSVTPLFTSISRVFNMRTGREFGSISDAVNDELTSDGDTIVLREGTFTENIIIHKKINVQSENREKVIIKSAKIDEPVFTIVNDNIKIQDLTIKGNDEDIGIFAYANNLQITDCDITGFKYGLMLQESHNTTIKNSKISDCDYGIYTTDSNDLRVQNSFIVGNEYGFSISNSTNTLIQNNNLTDNVYGGLTSTTHLSLTNNTLTNNILGFTHVKTTGTITYNHFKDNIIGITYQKSSNTVSEDNIFNGSVVLDSMLVDADGVVMQDNSWDCGPASLATTLKMKGTALDLVELAKLAQTDSTGTSMQGLITAAQKKGFKAWGLILNAADLKPGDIVVLKFKILGEDVYHFSVVKNIKDGMVFLADSSFGNIQIKLDSFKDMYTGYTIRTQNNTNQTTEDEGILMTTEQLQKIKGTNPLGLGFVLLLAASTPPGWVIIGAVVVATVVILAYHLYTTGYFNKRINRLHQIHKHWLNPYSRYSKWLKTIKRAGTEFIASARKYGRTSYTKSPHIPYINSKLYQERIKDYYKNTENALNTITHYLTYNPRIKQDKKQMKEYEKAQEMFKNLVSGGGDKKPGNDIAKVIEESARRSKNDIQKGVKLFKQGKRVEGGKHIFKGTAWGWISALIASGKAYEEWLKTHPTNNPKNV